MFFGFALAGVAVNVATRAGSNVNVKLYVMNAHGLDIQPETKHNLVYGVENRVTIADQPLRASPWRPALFGLSRVTRSASIQPRRPCDPPAWRFSDGFMNLLRPCRGNLFAALMLLLCAIGGTVRADVLVTADGESMSGDLARIVDGILVFRTSLRGQMMLPVSEVETLQTGNRWIVSLAGGGVHIGRFASDGILLDASGEGAGELVPVAYKNIKSAKTAPPLPKERETGWRGEEFGPWRYELAAGVESRFGSADRTVPFVEWNARRAFESNELGLRLRFDAPEADAPGDLVRGRLALHPREPRGWSPYLEGRAERNVEEYLSWRTGLSVGVRYDFSGEEAWTLAGYVGLAGYHSRWRRAPADWWRGSEDAAEEAVVGPQFGVRHARPVWGAGRWESGLTLNRGSASGSLFRAEAETVFTYPLTSRLRLRLDMLVSYEESPVYEALEPFDTRLGASFQLEF